MRNALKKYLEKDGLEGYGANVVKLAKKTGLTENSIRNIARYEPRDIDRMRFGSYKKLIDAGIDMEIIEVDNGELNN